MFANIGTKLKILAHISCWGGIAGSLIFGFTIIGDRPGLAILIMLAGSFCSWVSSLTTYGIGEAVDKATEAAQNSASRPAPAIGTDEKKLLTKLKEKDEEEENQRKQEEAQQRAEALKKVLAENGGSDWVVRFLGEAVDCKRIMEIKKLWEEFPKEENQITEEIGKKISDAAQVERMYGGTEKRKEKLLEEIRSMLT